MHLRDHVPLVLGLIGSLFVLELAAAAEPFRLHDGDRVVLLGGTFVEREGQFGDLETALTLAYPDSNITFRNLGWSGDTVWAESRGIFDPPAAGYQRMIELVKELKPTVILLAYGQNESFAGASGLPAFIKQYEKLCDDLASTQARLVFLTPLPLYSPDPLLTPAKKFDDQRKAYAAAVLELGERRGQVVDLGAKMDDCLKEWINANDRQTLEGLYDGMHLTPAGNRWAAECFCQTANVPLRTDIDPDKQAALKQLIVEKNTLFFHRWRPQNVTYLFLFRKHEQGNNAVDIPAFDKLTQQADERIGGLRQSTVR